MSIVLPRDLVAEVAAICNSTGQTASRVVSGLVREAIKARRGEREPSEPVEHHGPIPPLPPFVFRKTELSKTAAFS